MPTSQCLPPQDFKTTLPTHPSLIPPVNSTYLVCTQHILHHVIRVSGEGADYVHLITKKSFRKNLFFGSWPSFSMNTKFCATNKSLEQTKFFLKFEQNNLGQTKSFELDLLFWLGGNMLVINIFSCLAILIDNFSISIYLLLSKVYFSDLFKGCTT